MKFFDKLGKLEQGIGRTVGLSKGFGTFAKADVANRVRIMMDDESYVDGSGRTMAPNVYTLRFAPVDFPRVREWGNPFAVELCDLAISHARAQGYTLIGAVRVTFNVLDSLSEGEFEVVATFEPFSVPELPRPRLCAVLLTTRRCVRRVSLLCRPALLSRLLSRLSLHPALRLSRLLRLA